MLLWGASDLRMLYWRYVSGEPAGNMPRTGAAGRSGLTADACLKDSKTQHWAALRTWKMAGANHSMHPLPLSVKAPFFKMQNSHVCLLPSKIPLSSDTSYKRKAKCPLVCPISNMQLCGA